MTEEKSACLRSDQQPGPVGDDAAPARQLDQQSACRGHGEWRRWHSCNFGQLVMTDCLIHDNTAEAGKEG